MHVNDHAKYERNHRFKIFAFVHLHQPWAMKSRAHVGFAVRIVAIAYSVDRRASVTLIRFERQSFTIKITVRLRIK